MFNQDLNPAWDSVSEGIWRAIRTCPSITTKQLVAFLYVAENEGITLHELALLLRASDSLASRLMRSLLAEDAPRAIGAKLGLVEAVVRPDDRRVLELRLTPAGRELAGAIDAANRRRQPILRAAG